MIIDEFESYLLKEKRASTHTVLAYRNDCESFLAFIFNATNPNYKDVKEVNYQNIRAWIVHLVDEQQSNTTINRKLSSLRTFFNWMRKADKLQSNPMTKIKGLKAKKRMPEFVKTQEISTEKTTNLFTDDFFGRRDKMIFELLYQTGIRLSELINLKNIDISSTDIKVLGKRNKERLIPVSAALLYEIRQFQEVKAHSGFHCDYLLCTDKGLKLYPKFVYRKVNKYLGMISNIKKKSPHILRHTFATHLLNEGAGLEVLKEILGHANLSATQVYTHNSFSQLQKSYNLAHPRGENEI